jgi:hypothetical protein
LGILGLLIYRWRGLENTFPTVYYMPPKISKLQLQNKKEKSAVVYCLRIRVVRTTMGK